MRKRVLSFLLAASAAFCFICSSAPEAQAIVPIGFVQSALASYVSSTGYKLYNDNGTGQDILGSLGELYDDYVTVSNKTITGQLANLAFLANSPYIYQDNSGQIVVSKVAADIFQDFADWIQTEYSVPVGSDTPTAVLSGQAQYTDGFGVIAGFYSFTSSGSFTSGGTTFSVRYDPDPIGYYGTQPIYAGTGNSDYFDIPVFLTSYEGTIYCRASSETLFAFYVLGSDGRNMSSVYISPPDRWGTATPASVSSYYTLIPVSTSSPVSSQSISAPLTGSSATNLAVTLAQAVADVVGQAKEDDAVVIGVGASAGATAQDIADIVAQGIKAQTLNPSVSITAEAVIDTPVQPYPDIDGLGLPTLGAALVDRFPFCIPWDFVDTVRLLSADPQPINIKVDLIPQRVKTSVGITSDTSFDIDLSGEQYAKIGVFCRWGSLITFCFGLFLLTKRLVWTA